MSADALVRTTLGDYRLERLLGAGGMGAVYLAQDVALQRPVAVKVILEGARHDPERNARFLREARAAAQLVHPHIAQIYRVGEQAGVVYMALELVPGRALRDFIHRGALPIEAVIDVAAQIAGALGAAHERKIVHRDLKRDNVMVTPEGVAKVLDFGLAKSFGGGDTDAAGLTLEGAVVGTPAYMSPEQATGGPLDGRSDVFSFGVMLFEMLTGRLPFTGDTASKIVMAIVRDPPADLLALRPDVPGALVDIVTRCLGKDAVERFADGRAVKAALDRVGLVPAPGHASLTETMDALPAIEERPALIATEAATVSTVAAIGGPPLPAVPATATAAPATDGATRHSVVAALRALPSWVWVVLVGLAWGVGWAGIGPLTQDAPNAKPGPAAMVTITADDLERRLAAAHEALAEADSKTAL